jgi:hypothetical protein
MTILSISWLRRSGYSGPVRVVTDIQDWPVDRLGCEIERVPSVGEGTPTRGYKTRMDIYGYDTTLYLDADTLPVSTISGIWREARIADICMTRDLHPNIQDLVAQRAKVHGTWQGWTASSPEIREKEFRHMSDLRLMLHPYYNAGVMLFRRSAATHRLFEVWHEEWGRFRNDDQLALVRAIDKTGFRVHTLDPGWNARLTDFETIENAQRNGVHILHLRPWEAHLVQELLEQCAQPSEPQHPLPPGRE